MLISLHLLDIPYLTEAQIEDLFLEVDRLRDFQPSDALRDKTFVLFFPESSLRTRMTFEKGIHALGGETLVLPPSALDRREDLGDVIGYVQNWADGIVVRHSDFEILLKMALHAEIPVINAMTARNHPCEILSDLYIISRLRDNYHELVYTFVGGVGNIANSWKDIAGVLNLKFNHVCTKDHRLGPDSRNYQFHTKLEPALSGSDIVLTDSLTEELRTEKYIRKYQITLDRMKLAGERALLNPCPPFFRNEEVSKEVIDSHYFVGYGFKKNLLYVQQAILLYCCGLSIQELA